MILFDYLISDFHIIKEAFFRKIKNSILGSVNNIILENLCKSFSLNNIDIKVAIYPITVIHTLNRSPPFRKF